MFSFLLSQSDSLSIYFPLFLSILSFSLHLYFFLYQTFSWILLLGHQSCNTTTSTGKVYWKCHWSLYFNGRYVVYFSLTIAWFFSPSHGIVISLIFQKLFTYNFLFPPQFSGFFLTERFFLFLTVHWFAFCWTSDHCVILQMKEKRRVDIFIIR